MPLRDLVKRIDNSIAPDRAIYGDQYDLKIDQIYDDLIAICNAVDAVVVSSGAVLLDAGLTIWGSPTAGEIGYISSNSTLSKAQANSLSTSSVYGVYNGTSVVVSGVVSILFDSSLTLSPNDRVYLSPITAGRATNIAPTTGQVSVLLGILRSNTGYNSMTGSALPVRFSPRDPILLN